MNERSPTNKLAAALVGLALSATPQVAAAGDPPESAAPASTREPLDLDADRPYKRQPFAQFSALEIAGTVVVGVGVVFGAVGVGTFVQGNKARQELDDAIAGGDPEDRVQPLEDIARANETSTIMFASCGAAVVVGSIIYFTGRSIRRKKGRARLAAGVPMPSATRGGAAVNWSMRF